MALINTTQTSKIDVDVAIKVEKIDKVFTELHINNDDVFAENTKESCEMYDENNEMYKKYEKAEHRAYELTMGGNELPSDLKRFLASTINERDAWHEYCRTHTRKNKSNITKDISDIALF